jgi:hypothetical protein
LERISLALWRERVGRGDVVNGRPPFIHLFGLPCLTEENGDPLYYFVGTFRAVKRYKNRTSILRLIAIDPLKWFILIGKDRHGLGIHAPSPQNP